MGFISQILNKHVVISMSNGVVLEGFVQEYGEDHLTLVEFNNMIVLVKIQDICFVRILGSAGNVSRQDSAPEAETQEPPEQPTQRHTATEYSMDVQNVGPYQVPSFGRKT